MKKEQIGFMNNRIEYYPHNKVVRFFEKEIHGHTVKLEREETIKDIKDRIENKIETFKRTTAYIVENCQFQAS